MMKYLKYLPNVMFLVIGYYTWQRVDQDFTKPTSVDQIMLVLISCYCYWQAIYWSIDDPINDLRVEFLTRDHVSKAALVKANNRIDELEYSLGLQERPEPVVQRLPSYSDLMKNVED